MWVWGELFGMTSVSAYSMARSGHHAIMNWIRANTREDVTVYNHENAQVSSGPFRDSDYHVIILRDPYNWAASWLHSTQSWLDANIRKDRFSEWVERWKEHAGECAGETHHLGSGFVPVLYNKWFAVSKYRREIAERLNLGSEDKELNTVTNDGGGSSWTVFSSMVEHRK